MNTYTQLTEQERYQIYALKQAGHNDSKIAAFLGCPVDLLRTEGSPS